MQYSDHIKAILETLPEQSGVYIMKDAAAKVIYVGKAISLKNRVRQYFHKSANHTGKVQVMVPKIADIDYIVTKSEVEALVLECNLIKRYRPHYNILMKDDKQYPYIRIDLNQSYPTVEIVRKIENDGAKYFGPYLSAGMIDDVFDAISGSFPLRQCAKDIEKAQKNKERPCLNYQIKRCQAPCANKISKQQYRQMVEHVIDFLQGKYDKLTEELKQQMESAAKVQDYEQAALWRDRLKAVHQVLQKQHAAFTTLEDRDVVAFARSGDEAIVEVFKVRDGNLIGGDKMILNAGSESDEEVLYAFLTQYYDRHKIPREILVPVLPDDKTVIEQWLNNSAGKKVTLSMPQRGDKKKLLDLACRNAEEGIQKYVLRRQKQWQKQEGALTELAEVLGIQQPGRMECFDISNIQGVDNVASMTVFIDGKPEPKLYRRFKIKSFEGADDFRSIREVITRRLMRAMEPDAKSQAGFGQLPDLMVIDGGRGQLNSALGAMRETGFNIPMIGLAKKLEEIYIPGMEETILLNRTSPALHLLQSIRDEAHRFAVSYHRSLRASRELISRLDKIPGIGPKRRKALLTGFKTVEQMKNASYDELRAVEGMDKKSALAVYEYFNKTFNGGR